MNEVMNEQAIKKYIDNVEINIEEHNKECKKNLNIRCEFIFQISKFYVYCLYNVYHFSYTFYCLDINKLVVKMESAN